MSSANSTLPQYDFAGANRAMFRSLDLCAVSIISAPRAGKTLLLEHSLPALTKRFKLTVLETDLQASLDAARIRAAAGAPVWQVIAGADESIGPDIIGRVLAQFPIGESSLLIVERVLQPGEAGNPSWGEDVCVAVYSAADTAQFPIANYQGLIRNADAILLAKTDLMPGVRVEEIRAELARLNPSAPIFFISAKIDSGLSQWVNWLGERIEAIQRAKSAERPEAG